VISKVQDAAARSIVIDPRWPAPGALTTHPVLTQFPTSPGATHQNLTNFMKASSATHPPITVVPLAQVKLQAGAHSGWKWRLCFTRRISSPAFPLVRMVFFTKTP